MTSEEKKGLPHRILAIYKFVSPARSQEAVKTLQQEIEAECRKYRARGTLLLAQEGTNGTICYPFDPKQEKDPLLDYLQGTCGGNPRIRLSQTDYAVFPRLKIKIKSEIVTMQQEGCHPTELVGNYCSPEKWNELLSDPECLVVDTRNEYEVHVGTFRNAVNPHLDHFTEFPDWMEKNLSGEKAPKRVAMFCTGGIRCEKATNACMKLVPDDVPVYHLEGGILAYLDKMKPDESMFDGDCYVFDKRIAVTYDNQPSTKFTTSCRACRHPLAQEDIDHEDFVNGLSCRWCVGKLTDKQRDRFASRQKQVELARQRGTVHIHDPKEACAAH